MTKYQELKATIKANAELTRVLKNHRKTVRFIGERKENVVMRASRLVYNPTTRSSEEQFKDVVVPVLTADAADRILRGYYSVWERDDHWYVVSPSYENARLFTIYGILRNERKTKKIQCWLDIIETPGYEDSRLKKEVDQWRDEEVVCPGE